VECFWWDLNLSQWPTGFIHCRGRVNYRYRSTSYSHTVVQRRLRSSTTRAAALMRIRTEFGRRAFSVAGPDIWNSLPPQIRLTENFSTFRKKLKIHQFDMVFFKCSFLVFISFISFDFTHPRTVIMPVVCVFCKLKYNCTSPLFIAVFLYFLQDFIYFLFLECF